MEKMNKHFVFRKDGNCFANCIVGGCILQGDSKFLEDSSPQLKIFNIETLYSSTPEDEFAPALNYLYNNNYDVTVYDPSHLEPWGNNLQKLGKCFHNTNCSKDYITMLLKENWCVVPSVYDSKKRPIHAILLFRDSLYDPENKGMWDSPLKVSDRLDDYIIKSGDSFLIAFRKLRTP
ncbi:MAG: hypothetical protein Q7R51_02410 [bacterium]|nr:hypothetical protein [bacterium]